MKCPDEWAELLSVLTPAERGDVMKSYKAIFDMVPANAAEKERQLKAALTWSLWEGVISNMIPETADTGKFGEADFALCFAQIEAHYFANARSEERRVGKECVSTCKSRWSPYP